MNFADFQGKLAWLVVSAFALCLAAIWSRQMDTPSRAEVLQMIEMQNKVAEAKLDAIRVTIDKNSVRLDKVDDTLLSVNLNIERLLKVTPADVFNQTKRLEMLILENRQKKWPNETTPQP